MNSLVFEGRSKPLDLIVGIGNPGDAYADTRHNAGIWFLEKMARRHGGIFKYDKKFHGRIASIAIGDRKVRLLVPNTYMNESGKSVNAMVKFFNILPEAILVAHDEIDLPTGKVRLKQSGGLAGHNGLRDISRLMGNSLTFNRLRIGVGHPGNQTSVTSHVLSKVSSSDREMINTCIDEALRVLPIAVSGDWQGAMQVLHNAQQPYQRG